jgi:hypothetical protein
MRKMGLYCCFLLASCSNDQDKTTIVGQQDTQLTQQTLADSIASLPLSKRADYELTKAYEKIVSCRFNEDQNNYDTIEQLNEYFRTQIVQYICKDPNSLSYTFDSLNQRMQIETSNDKLFRIYSWNTWMGGTMEDFESVIQYKFNDSVYTKIYFDTTYSDEWVYYGFYPQIFTMVVEDKTYYLAVENKIYSTIDASHSIKAFCIENNSLNDTIKLFKTPEGFSNALEIYFDFFSVVHRPERPLKLITYDEKKKIVYLPIVDEDDQVTDAFQEYRFTGTYFELMDK